MQEQPLLASCIRFLLATPHKVLDETVRIAPVARNGCDSVKPPRLLEAARGSQLETLLTVALATGMRRGELLGLKWRDINLDKGSLQVARSMDRAAGHGVVESEPKTAQGRRQIALAPFAVEVLKQHRIHQLEARLKAGPNWNEHDLVFCNVYGNFLHPFRLYTMFHKVLTDADLPPYALSRPQAQRGHDPAGNGVNIKVVQEILGHSQVSMTLGIYSHVLPGMQEEAMGKMHDLLNRRRGDDEEEMK